MWRTTYGQFDMPSLVLIVPGSLESLTGGYTYDRRMMTALRSWRR
jgi:hypothetical protein